MLIVQRSYHGTLFLKYVCLLLALLLPLSQFSGRIFFLVVVDVPKHRTHWGFQPRVLCYMHACKRGGAGHIIGACSVAPF